MELDGNASFQMESSNSTAESVMLYLSSTQKSKEKKRKNSSLSSWDAQEWENQRDKANAVESIAQNQQ